MERTFFLFTLLYVSSYCTFSPTSPTVRFILLYVSFYCTFHPTLPVRLVLLVLLWKNMLKNTGESACISPFRFFVLVRSHSKAFQLMQMRIKQGSLRQ